MPLPSEQAPSPVRHFWIRLAIAVVVILVVAVVSRAQQSSPPKADEPPSATGQPTIAGTWKLNRDESDDPRAKLRAAIQDREQNGTPGGTGRRGGMGGGGIGMGIPGMGGGMGRPGNGQQGSGSDDQRARMLDIVEPPDQLTVAQTGPEIDMTDTQSRTRALFTDGRKIDKPKKDALQSQVKARWEGQTLITEEKGPNGEKISHVYELSPEGKFVDTLTLETKRLNTPIIVRSVYDKPE